MTEAQKKEMDEKEIELWEEKAKSGLLRSDRILTNLVSQLRWSLSSAVEGIGGLNTLSKIGITTGAGTNTGNCMSTKLNFAVQSRTILKRSWLYSPKAVKHLIARELPNG